MHLEFERTETHETIFRGRLSGEQIKTLLMAAIRDSVGTKRFGLRLTLDPLLPDVAFELVHDHDWHMKPEQKTEAEPVAHSEGGDRP